MLEKFGKKALEFNFCFILYCLPKTKQKILVYAKKKVMFCSLLSWWGYLKKMWQNLRLLGQNGRKYWWYPHISHIKACKKKYLWYYHHRPFNTFWNGRVESKMLQKWRLPMEILKSGCIVYYKIIEIWKWS